MRTAIRHWGYLLVFAVVVIVIVNGMATAQTGPTSDELRNFFTPATCQRACFLGIEPDRTTLAELRQIVSDRGSTLVMNAETMSPIGTGDENNSDYSFELPATPLLLIPNSAVQVSVSDGIVRFIRAGADFPTALAIEAFGPPTQATLWAEEVIQFAYKDLGLGFAFNRTDPGTIGLIILGGSYATEVYLIPELGQGIAEVSVCPLVEGECLLATATLMAPTSTLITPAPSATPRATSTP